MKNNNYHYERTKEFHRISAVEKDGYYDALTACKSVEHNYFQLRVRRIILNTLDELLNRGNSDIFSAIDVGCGRGDFTVEIAKRYSQLKQIHGCDFVKEALSIAKRLSESMGNIKLHEANMLNMPFDDHSLDLTVCVNTLHHIYIEDMEKALSELARITRKYLILEIKNNNNFIYNNNLINKYILPKSLHGMNIYPTSIEKTSKILGNYNFKLISTSGIFMFNWLSPLVIITYENQT